MEADCLKRSINITRLDNGKGELANLCELKPETNQYPDCDHLADEISSFVHSVMNRCRPVVPGEDGRRALKISLEIIDQIKRGCRDIRCMD